MILSEITQKLKCKYLSDEAKDFVLRHCQPYLNAVGYDLDTYAVFRGVSRGSLGRMEDTHIESLYMTPGSYDKRKPKDSPQVIHDLANKLFVKKFGVPFRNGVFVTGATRNAKYYGNVVQVIPIGDFKFCWSPQVQDFYTVTEESRFEQEAVAETRRLISTEYKNTDLKKAILSHHEIMLYCEKVLINFTSGVGSHFVIREGGYHIGNGDTSISVASEDTYKIMNPTEANEYCNRLVHENYSDWVLPTTREMKTMIFAMRNEPGFSFNHAGAFICKGKQHSGPESEFYEVNAGSVLPVNPTSDYMVVPIRRTMV